jgi:predicted metal-dependent phosphoesterase TrpH
MLLELHAHTNRHSKCSIIDPVELVKRTVSKGLQGLVITEHHYLWSGEELARLRADACVEKWFMLFSGQEVDTDIGHVLVYGAGRTIENKTSLKALREEFPAAALVWAHPFRKGAAPSAEKLTSPLLDGVEIFSLNHSAKENFAALKSWHSLKFTALSGSDVHSGENAGAMPTQFDHGVSTLDEAVIEIKKGRVRPFYKEIPKSGSDLTVTEITLGTKGGDELRQRIIVKNISGANKWEKAKRSAAFLSEIYKGGFNDGVYRVPRIIDTDDKERTLIEEGQRGKNLFDALLGASPAEGLRYLKLAAKWLAKFHSLKALPAPAPETLEHEKNKLDSYRKNFRDTGSPYLGRALELIDLVEKRERDILLNDTASFTPVHGDYHVKNIIIGHDRNNDPGTVFVSAIDFANSFTFLPAFDIGCFLAQFSSQFRSRPDILLNFGEEDFLRAYAGEAAANSVFQDQVNLFKARAFLSIANYFIRVGMGESPEMLEVISNCEAAAGNAGGSRK